MKGVKTELTEKQLSWLDKHFKNTKNEEVASKLGISPRTAVRIARQRGLEKTRQFIRKCQEHAAHEAWLSNTVNGTFPPKGFVIPNSEKYRFKPGVRSVDRIGKKKEAERLRKSKESMAVTWKKEKARVLFGLDQKTNLRIGRQDQKRVGMRWYLKSRGYVLHEQGNERIAYWTDKTKRAVRLEANGCKYFEFAPFPSENTTL